MVPLKPRRVLLVLCLFLVAGCSALWIMQWDSEEYAVDETVIRDAFGGEDVSYYVILATTEPAGRFGISSFHSRELNLPLSGNASYTAKNVFRFEIAPRFRLPHEFTMVVQKLGRNYAFASWFRPYTNARCLVRPIDSLRSLWRRNLPLPLKTSWSLAHR